MFISIHKPDDVSKTTINQPLGNGLHLFMVKLGMVYSCSTHMNPHLNKPVVPWQAERVMQVGDSGYDVQSCHLLRLGWLVHPLLLWPSPGAYDVNDGNWIKKPSLHG